MTLEEKARTIKEYKKKEYLCISSKIITSGETPLVYNYDTLTLYENMDDNTRAFAENEIIDLISCTDGVEPTINKLSFRLIYCGGFDEIPEEVNPNAFIMDNKDKIVAIYRYVKSTETRNIFVGFAQPETINKYGYMYLNFAKLLDAFKENNIDCKIYNEVENKYTPGFYRDDRYTLFTISYNKEKQSDSKKTYKPRKGKK